MPLAGYALGSMGEQVLQTLYLELLVDTTTTSTSYVDLLSVVAATSGGVCLVIFSVGGGNSTTNTNVRFQVTLDGVVQRGTKLRQDTGAGSPGVLVCRTAPAAGPHTFKVRWSVSTGNGRIRAATINEEHASILIKEIAR